jgi:glycoprotein-N-acetylgalactosamine 3-beta-galactosyltransferase
MIVNGGYHSGGAGYLIPREALNRIGSKLRKDYDFCSNSGIEDVDVAKCLKTLGVSSNSSLDELGRER